jgi:hypothetical protein
MDHFVTNKLIIDTTLEEKGVSCQNLPCTKIITTKSFNSISSTTITIIHEEILFVNTL